MGLLHFDQPKGKTTWQIMTLVASRGFVKTGRFFAWASVS